MTGEERPDRAKRNRRTALTLGLLVFGMFGFGFALVPLYDVLCKVTGIQSIAIRSDRETGSNVTGAVDASRLITVKFDTTVHPSLPWEFEAVERSVRVHPGEMREVVFKARNRSSDRVTGQAIPSVAPWQATPYFNKLECFCFNKQTLTAGESVDMPLRFIVSETLPADIRSLTLSYSFMKLNQLTESQNQLQETRNVSQRG